MKFNLIFLKGTNRMLKGKIKQITGMRESKVANIYLGNSLILGKVKSREFEKLKDRV